MLLINFLHDVMYFVTTLCLRAGLCKGSYKLCSHNSMDGDQIWGHIYVESWFICSYVQKNVFYNYKWGLVLFWSNQVFSGLDVNNWISWPNTDKCVCKTIGAWIEFCLFTLTNMNVNSQSKISNERYFILHLKIKTKYFIYKKNNILGPLKE